MKDTLIIGSRGSKLALKQAESIQAELILRHPSIEVRIEIIRTTGDVKTEPLSVIGGKGVFTKELEEALLDGRIDLAVHSLKDLPTIVPESLRIAAICRREDPRDALVLNWPVEASSGGLTSLREGAVVGTSSQRRLAQIKHLRPDLDFKDVRGNVDTRLRKLDEGQYDALVLACAGLRRLGLENRLGAILSTTEMLPAVGQGALAIETRADDAGTVAVVTTLDDAPTRLACTAERAFLRGLGGGCELPIAGYAEVDGEQIRLQGLVADRLGERILRDEIRGSWDKAETLGQQLASLLLQRGANTLLEKAS